MVSFPLNRLYVSLGLRAAQLVLALIVLGLGAGISHYYEYSRASYSIFVGVITFLWIGVLLLPAVTRFIPPFGVFIAEVLLWIFWLAQFAAMADVYGSLDCGYHYYTYTPRPCHLGKAAIAMGVINWVLFSVSLGLFIVYTLVPSVRAATQFWRFAGGSFVYGSIFTEELSLPPATVTDTEADPEPKVESLDDEPVSTGPVSAEPAVTVPATAETK